MSRLHSVENLVKTKYVAPSGNVVQGATVSVAVEKTVDNAQDNTLYAIFVTKNQDLSALNVDVDFAVMQPLLQAQNFTGANKSQATIVNKAGKPVVVVGLGERPTLENLRVAAGLITTKARADKREQVVIYANTGLKIAQLDEVAIGYGRGGKTLATVDTVTVDVETVLDAIIRGALYNNWAHDKFVDAIFAVSKYVLVTEEDVSINAINTSVAGAESVTFAREIGSLRFSVADNTYMKNQAVAVAQANDDVLKIRVADKEELTKDGYNLILAVNQGSVDPCYIVAIEYTPPGYVENGVAPYAYVGKTLTFDTGGYDLKPPAAMEGMHCDKHGGCNTLSLMRFLALTRPQTGRKIVGVMTITDNEIGSKAVHPHTIIETVCLPVTGERAGKKTVAIDNTDAEGRLALADAVSFVQKNYSPARVTTMATLTGAIMISLGHHATGLFSNTKYVPAELSALGEVKGDLFWHMPILTQHHSELAGTDCDLKNITGQRWGGSSTAAAFIEQFVQEGVEFVHLDIAGVSSRPGNESTGATLNTLQAYIAKH